MIHKNYPMVELKTAPFYPLWLLVMEWQDRLASSLVKLYLQTVDLLWDVRQYFPDGPEIVSIYLVKFSNHDGSRWITMDIGLSSITTMEKIVLERLKSSFKL